MQRYATDPYRVMSSHVKTDVTDIIRQVMASPIKKTGEVREADGIISMEELSKSNTTVQTRIVTQMAFNAIQGDVKSATFLMTYGGYAAPEVRENDDDTLVIIDDVTNRLEPIPPSRLALADGGLVVDNAVEEVGEDGAEVVVESESDPEPVSEPELSSDL